MTSASNLTSLAATAGEIHGAVVASIIRGSGQKPRSTPPPLEKPLAVLRETAKLSKEDFEKLSQIVTLAKNKPARLAETQLQLRQIDEALQRKPASVHPLVLTISGIANDSATTALSAQTSTNGNKATRQLKKEEQVVTTNVLLADVAGAVMGGYLAAKKGLSSYQIVVAALVCGSVASSEVGSGEPFPNFQIE